MGSPIPPWSFGAETWFACSFDFQRLCRPCRQVAEVVCACEPDQSSQRSCLSEVEVARAAHPATDADLAACDEVLASEQCTCDALALGEIEACGLAQTP